MLEETSFGHYLLEKQPTLTSLQHPSYTRDNMKEVFDSICTSVSSDRNVIIKNRIQASPYPVVSG